MNENVRTVYIYMLTNAYIRAFRKEDMKYVDKYQTKNIKHRLNCMVIDTTSILPKIIRGK